MEKKLPDDNLEEFLRNSFNQYTESPSDNVWNRIDNSLQTSPVRKKPIYKKLYYPIAATVVLSLLTFLIYTNYKLRNKLDAALSEKNVIAQHNTGVPAESTKLNKEQVATIDSSTDSQLHMSENNSDSKIITINKNLIPAEIKTEFKIENIDKIKLADNSGKEEDKIILKSIKQNALHADNPKNSAINNLTEITNIVAASSAKSRKQNSKIKYNVSNQNQPVNTKTIAKVNTNEKQNSELYEKAEKQTEVAFEHNPDKEIKDVSSSIANESRIQFSEKIYISSLPMKNSELLNRENKTRFTTQYPVNMYTIPIRGINATEAGIFAGTLHESGKIDNEHDGRPIGPKGGKRTNEFNTNDSWQIGLSLNKSIAQNLYLTSGIGYKHFDIVNEIKESITFGNRKPKPGGMPFQHDFDFKIKCNGGSSDIVIKSEQLDQRASLTDNQPVELNVRTEFELNYLSIPIGLQYRFSKNKFFAGLGLGINIDLLAKSRVSNSEVKILNNILKPIEQPQLVRLGQTQDVVLNSKANIVMGYTINKNFKFFVSPEMIMPLSNRTQDKDGRIETNAWGLQAGLAYTFN